MQFNKQWKDFLMEERYPDLLLEARVKDVKAKYPVLTDSGWINWAQRQITHLMGPKGVSKYLMWFAREVDRRIGVNDPDELRDDPDVLEMCEAILERAMLFNQNQHKFEEKDIYKYHDEELKRALDKLGVTTSAKAEQAAAEKKQAEENSEVVYNDHGIFAVRPLTTEASCYYGQNPRLTSWCISETEKRNYFVQYTQEEGKVFVITKFSGIPEGHPNHLITLQFDHEGDLTMLWDAPNKAQDPDDLWNIIREHLDGMPEYKNEDEAFLFGLTGQIYHDITREAKEWIMHNPPPSPQEAAERACEVIQNEANSDLEHVSVYYDIRDSRRNPAPEVYYGATVEFSIDTTGEEYRKAEKDLEDIDYSDVRTLERMIEDRMSENGIYGYEELDIDADGEDIRVELKMRAEDAMKSIFRVGRPPEFILNVEGFREFCAFTAAAADKEVDDIIGIIKAVLAQEGYAAPSGQQVMVEYYKRWRSFLAEAQQDSKILRNLNIKALQKEVPQGPEEETRDYFARIQAMERDPEYLNPIFPQGLVDWIESLPDNHFPREGRKRFAKWLGNAIYTHETEEKSNFNTVDHPEELRVYNNDVRYIVDYLNGAPEVPGNVWDMTFQQVFELSEEWHGTLGGDEAIEDSRMARKVVYDFKNGYVIVDVPSQDLGIEGHILNHCVGGYCDTVSSGRAKIFSLRGPARKAKARKDYPDLHNSKNFPYATVEVDASGTVEQIKGNRNGIPKSGDAKMIKAWLRTTDLDYENSIDYKNLVNVEDDLKPFLEGDGFVENYEDAMAVATHPDPEIHGYILKRFEEEIAKRGGTEFLDEIRAWGEDDPWVDKVIDELTKNNELEIPEIIKIAKLGYRIGIGSMIGPLLDPNKQNKYEKYHEGERNNIIARAVYEEMKDELFDPTPREDDNGRNSLLRQQVFFLSAIAQQDRGARQEIVDFLLSPEMVQRQAATSRPNNVYITTFRNYLHTASKEYAKAKKENQAYNYDAIMANPATVKGIFDFQNSEEGKKILPDTAPDQLLVAMADLPKLPQEVLDHFVEYTSKTSGVNNSKITNKVIASPGVDVEIKKKLIYNSYMKDEQHMPMQGYRYSAYAKIFARRLYEVLPKVGEELAQWMLDNDLFEPLFVEKWRLGIVRNTGRNVDAATLNSEQAAELRSSIKRQRKNVQRQIKIRARKEKEKLQEQIQKYFGKNIMTKDSFYDNVESMLTEEKGRSRQRGIYKFYCMLSYGLTNEGDKTRGLDDILADLRALPNVTIVTVVVKNQKIAEGRYIAGLSIKFIPSIPGQFRSPEDVKSRILRDIRRLANVKSIFKVSAGLERLE